MSGRPRVTVTAADHKRAVRIYRESAKGGEYQISESCPLALALKRTFSTEDAWAAVIVAKVDGQSFVLAETARRWMDQWDAAIVESEDGDNGDFPPVPVTFVLRPRP